MKEVYMFNFNVTKQEWYGCSSGVLNRHIDFIKTVKEQQSMEKIIEPCEEWSSGEKIVQLIITQGFEPYGYVVNDENKYNVIITCSQNDEDGIHIDDFKVIDKESGVSIKYQVQSETCDFNEAKLVDNNHFECCEYDDDDDELFNDQYSVYG